LAAERAATHYNLAICLVEQKRTAEAEASLREALRLSPTYPEAHKALANVLNQHGRRQEAIEHYRTHLEARPDDIESLTELGMLLALNGQAADEASVLLKHAVRLRPHSAEAHNSLGLAQMAQGRFEEAEASYDRALTLDPRFASAHTNLGTNYKEQGRLREALVSFEMALRFQPQSPSTHWNRALTWLQSGDYEQGWPEYEWRWKRETSPMRSLPKPMWDGSDLNGRTILLWSEQGLGDTVQFIRYARFVKERGGRVIFECPSPLGGCLRACRGIDLLLVEGEPLPHFDVHLPIMSAPAVFRTALATVPNEVPYLLPNAERIARWKAGIEETVDGKPDDLRVGIAWQGNPHHPLDRFRSAMLEDFRPLAHVPAVRLFSLQRGPGSEQLDRWCDELGVVELTRRDVVGPEDWADTAAIISNLDLIVTVDTATAHVAGALGADVFVALAASPDWRWMLRRSDTPWYPTMRLFRQQKLRDWPHVFDRIAFEVRQWRSHRSRNRRCVSGSEDINCINRALVLNLCSFDR
jgi:Flp pilus assembly protein TadD